MSALPGNLLSKIPIDADLVRRLHEEDPFFRARADRYAILDDVIRSQELAPFPQHKYLKMLKQRREALLLELVEIIASDTPATQDPLWKITPTKQKAPTPMRAFRWP